MSKYGIENVKLEYIKVKDRIQTVVYMFLAKEAVCKIFNLNIDYNNNIKGDIVSLANKPIRFISFSGSPNISGDIVSLANITYLS